MYIQITDNRITAKAEWEFPGSQYTDREVICAWDGKFYFAGEEPEFVDEQSYEEKRAEEYPPYQDYLDAVVKINSGDDKLAADGQQQLQEYYNACLNIKNKYPKE